MKVKRKTVMLGWAESLLWDEPNRQHVVYFDRKECALCCNGVGTEIYLLPTKKMSVDSIQTVNGRESRLFRRWSGFDAYESFKIDISTDRLIHVGTALQIDYASDKWTGRIAHYRHDFERKSRVYVDKKKTPKIWGIRCGGRRIVTARGIV